MSRINLQSYRWIGAFLSILYCSGMSGCDSSSVTMMDLGSEPVSDLGPLPTSTPAAGNPDGKCAIPAEAQAESITTPTTVIGTGTPASCTSDAVVGAVAKGGVITFHCGPDPITITMTQTAKIFNDKGPKIVIDGGGKVTLSGGGKVRILYQHTCDQAQKWTTNHCNDQDHP